jgi:hypothetical protein
MENFEQIERNLSGQSSDEEYLYFKDRLKNDKNLADDVLHYLNTKQAVRAAMINYGAVPFYQRHLGWSVTAAAAAAVILGIGFAFLCNGRHQSVAPGTLAGKQKTMQVISPADTLKNTKPN